VLAAVNANNLRMALAKSPVLNSSDLFEAWRSADQAARIAERSVFCQAMRALDGMCEFPSPATKGLSRNLRAKANELFEIAMAKMDERHSDANRSYWRPTGATPRIRPGAIATAGVGGRQSH